MIPVQANPVPSTKVSEVQSTAHAKLEFDQVCGAPSSTHATASSERLIPLFRYSKQHQKSYTVPSAAKLPVNARDSRLAAQPGMGEVQYLKEDLAQFMQLPRSEHATQDATPYTGLKWPTPPASMHGSNTSSLQSQSLPGGITCAPSWQRVSTPVPGLESAFTVGVGIANSMQLQSNIAPTPHPALATPFADNASEPVGGWPGARNIACPPQVVGSVLDSQGFPSLLLKFLDELDED